MRIAFKTIPHSKIALLFIITFIGYITRLIGVGLRVMGGNKSDTGDVYNFCMFQVAAVPVQCLWKITFLLLNV